MTEAKPAPSTWSRNVITLVVVAALGYFVDIYDLILFGVVRVESLQGIGITASAAIERQGELLLDIQMAGLLIGGIIWGILGDKRGRLTVLFGSIIIYSLANIANGFVETFTQYAIARFIAGIGLAGELGAGITLVSEVMSKEKRGIGTTIVATFGLLGAVVANLVGGYDWALGVANWRVAYFVGGGLGLLLLILRINVYESGMFKALRKQASVQKGNFLSLFTNRSRLLRYLQCIGIGVPIWYMVGILVFFSPELSQEIGVSGTVVAGTSIMLAYIGLSVGDLLCGLLSQALKSRRKAVFVFMSLSLVASVYYAFARDISPLHFYVLSFVLGLGAGYWAVFVTIGSEQFGTNIRATVTTTVPNFVRGSLILVSLLYISLRDAASLQLGRLNAALITGLVVFALAYWALARMPETFGKDLDYVEEG